MRIFPDHAIAAILSIVSILTPTARASVYRCIGEDGHISYQQIRCDSEARPMRLKDRQSGLSALRPGEKALLNHYRKKDAERYRKHRGGERKSIKDNRMCLDQKKQLEVVRAKLRHGYTLKEDAALHRRRDDAQAYLRKFCS